MGTATGRSLRGEGTDVAAEDIGRTAAQLFLEEVAKGGVVDSCHQGISSLLEMISRHVTDKEDSCAHENMSREASNHA